MQIFVSTETYTDADKDQTACRQEAKEVKRITNIARQLKQTFFSRALHEDRFSLLVGPFF